MSTTNRIVIWAGSDIHSIIPIKDHASPKSFLDIIQATLEDDFGLGAKLERVSDDKYIVNVDGVRV